MLSGSQKYSSSRSSANQSEFRFSAQVTARKKPAKKAAKKAPRKTTRKVATKKTTAKRATKKKTAKQTIHKRVTPKASTKKTAKKTAKKSTRKKTNTLNKTTGRGSLAFTNPIASAHKRARQITNQRLNQRATQTCKKNVIAVESGYAAEVQPYDHSLSIPSRVWRWVLAILIIPICIITTMTLVQVVAGTGNISGSTWEFLRSNTFLFFILGFVSMGSSFWFCQNYSHDHWLIEKVERSLLYLYVLGHEYTHALFVYLSLGWVSKISVSTDGGYVETNKSNLMIALSPYFVPFWSLVSLLVMMGINALFPMTHFNMIMTILLGATWTFHFYWTIWMIPRDQPDLKENGTFFSLTIIYLANILLLSVLVAWASSAITHNTFLNGWTHNGEAVFSGIKQWITSNLI